MSKQATNTETVLLPEDDLVPIALIALEVGESVDSLVNRFGEAAVVLDDIGMRSVRADVAREFFAEQVEWKARFEANQRRREAESAGKRTRPIGVPAAEGLSPFEALVAAEAKAGTYSTPKDDFGPGWGNPRQELMDEEFARSAEIQAEKKRIAEERKKERLAKQMKEDLQ